MNKVILQYGLNEVQTKLTAITITANGRKFQTFADCEVHGSKTILPAAKLTAILNKLGVTEGGTYTIG
jgi:hypothetical protein